MCSHLYKDEKKGQAFFIQVSKIWMRIWLFLIGCSVKIHGKENLFPNENFIVVFNHQSLMDIPLSAPFVPGLPNKTIGKSSFAKVPIFGWFYAKGTILVDRKSEISRRKSYEDMKDVLLNGMHVCIYPEGTRNRTNEPLKPFYDGAFKLSIDCQKPVLPCIIRGTGKASPVTKSFYLLPSILSMTFLKPIYPGSFEMKDLKDEVFEKMKFEIASNV